jgi:MraZ protein
MVTRKTQIKWMAAGGIFCLFGVGLFFQLSDGNKANAETDKSKEVTASDPVTAPLPTETKEPPKPDEKPQLAPPSHCVGKELPPDFHGPIVIHEGVPCQIPARADIAIVSDKEEKKKPEPPVAPIAPVPPPDATDTKPLVEEGKSLPPLSGAGCPSAPLSASEKKPEPTPVPPTAACQPPMPPTATCLPAPMPSVPTITESQAPTPVAPDVKPMGLKQVGLEEVMPIPPGTCAVKPAAAQEVVPPPPPTSGGAPPVEPVTPLRPMDPPMPKPESSAPPTTTEAIKPLPLLHPHKVVESKAKELQPLTGTFPCSLDDKKTLVLPKAVCEQFGATETLLVSPGPDHCLWLTNQAHLARLAQRLEESSAREIDVRVFKRLYFAQTEKASLSSEGKFTLPDRMAQFAGLGSEVILIGDDDHVEVWDAARWKKYTQEKSIHEE